MNFRELDLETLMKLLTGQITPEELMKGTDPESAKDITPDDMVKGKQLITDMLACESLAGFSDLANSLKPWHDETKDNKYRHTYFHAAAEMLPLMAIVLLGAAAIEDMEAMQPN